MALEEAEEHVEIKDAGQAPQPPRRCVTHAVKLATLPGIAGAPGEDAVAHAEMGRTTTVAEQGTGETQEEGLTGGTIL